MFGRFYVRVGAGPTMSRKHETGQALVITALAMVVLLGFGGLAVDVGTLRYSKRQMQKASDASAIAGASELIYNGAVTTAAQADASTNGFTNGTNGASVTVNNPPQSGPHAGNASYVEVLISQSQPTFFTKIFGVTSATVSARSVAWAGASGTSCIYVLSPTASSAFTQSSGSASTYTPTCGIYVDSNASNAMTVSGGGTITSDAIGVVGGDSISGGSTVTPTPVTSVAPVPDPLAYVQVPSVPSNAAQDSLNLCKNTPPSCSIPGNIATATAPDTLYPGLYAGITLSGGAYATLQPGLYYIQGGGLTLSGTDHLSGTGVTIYNSGTSSNPSNCKSVDISGGSTANLSAPTSGSLAGILFFQNRSCSTSATISGGSVISVTGALYFADALLTYSGGSAGESNYTILVSNTLTISGGSAYIDNDFSSLLSGNSPIRTPVLVE